MQADPIQGSPRPPQREIRADYSACWLTIYQAYATPIASAALEAQRFVPPFRFDRMTWIKPSFLWMMYRSGWATKPGQEHILKVRLRRDAFDAALRSSVLSHFVPDVHESREQWREQCRLAAVVVQWDPDRDLHLRPLPHRAIQIGIRGEVIHRYATDWIVSIEEVTQLACAIRDRVRVGDIEGAREGLPREDPYPVAAEAAARLGMIT